MKKKRALGDFYTVPRFIVSDLQLECGPLRDLFAIIYGFSQDGESGCECNLEYFTRWTLLSESTVRRHLQVLEDAHLITRVEIGIGRGSIVRYTANMKEIDEIRKGVKLTPIKRVSNLREKGVKSARKGCQIDEDTYDRNKIRMYNNFFFARTRDTRALLEEEKKNFFILFFFKNAAAPLSEVEAFVRVNELAGWIDSKGRPLDTSMKRMIWADGWKIQTPGTRVNPFFLDVWKAIYNVAMRAGDPIVDQLLDTRIICESNRQLVTLTLPAAVHEWLEDQIGERGQIYETLASFLQGRKLYYIDLVL